MQKHNKEKRIDKEIFLLRNLPKEFKIGKKETQLGILIDVGPRRCLICWFSWRSTGVWLSRSTWTRR